MSDSPWYGAICWPITTAVGVPCSPHNASSYNHGDCNSMTAITVGNFPYGVAVTPDGTQAYVTNGVSNTVSVIATASNTVVATGPHGE